MEHAARHRSGDTQATTALSAAVHNTATTTATLTPAADGTLPLTGATPKVDAMVATHDGVLGLVSSTGPDGAVVDPTLQATTRGIGSRAETAVTAEPSTLTTTPAGAVSFTSADPGYRLADGNRIVLHGFGGAGAVLNFGRVTPGPDHTWTLQRSAASRQDPRRSPC